MRARRAVLPVALSGLLLSLGLPFAAQPASAAPEWTDPRYLSAGPVERFDVAANDAGDAVAAWEEISAEPSGQTISVADRRAGGGWGRSQQFVGDRSSNLAPVVTIDRAGLATLVTEDEVRTKEPQGKWSAPYIHAAVADPDGRVYVFHQWSWWPRTSSMWL